MAPKATALAACGKVMLAGTCLPSTGARLQLSDFHAPRFVVPKADMPIIAVAAHIDVAPARSDIVLGRIEHAFGIILRVTAGDDAVVGGKRRLAFPVQVLVGHQLVVIALMLQPGDDREIGGNCQVMPMAAIRHFGRMFRIGRR